MWQHRPCWASKKLYLGIVEVPSTNKVRLIYLIHLGDYTVPPPPPYERSEGDWYNVLDNFPLLHVKAHVFLYAYIFEGGISSILT